MSPRTMNKFLYTVCSTESRFRRSDSRTIFRLSGVFFSLTKLARTLCFHSHQPTGQRLSVKGEQQVPPERCTSCRSLHDDDLSSTCSSHACYTHEGHTCQTCEARRFQFRFQTLKSALEVHTCHAGMLRLFHCWFTPQYHCNTVAPSSTEKRQLYTCSASAPDRHHQICVNGEKPRCQSQRQILVRHSSALAPRKRIRLHQSEQIEQVLAESTETILVFAAVLGCSEAEMTDMVRRDTRLVTQFSKHSVIAKMRLLLRYGFQPREIISRHQVIARSLDLIHSRLAAMEPVKHYRHRLVLLLLSQAQFQSRIAAYQREVAIMGEHSCQASFVAELLECTQEEVRTFAEQKHCGFLLTSPPSRLQEVIQILQSFGVSTAMMRERSLMLKCPPEVAQRRLRRARDAGVLELSRVPHIMVSSDSSFRRSFTKWVQDAEALGGRASERELLMDRLGCSEKELEDMLTRKPHVARMKSGKLKRCLDVLQKEMGLSSAAILQQGDLLHFSEQRLLSRWALLKPFNLPEPALVKDLMLTERKFVAKYGFESR